ncbi:MAG: ATP-binding protein [Actinomycetota bacterium]|nr:ATP-binding protein [Actinomycetota bacterium]
MRFVHELDRDPTALQPARQALETWCSAEQIDPDSILIIANELCSNAIRHGTGQVLLRAISSPTWIGLGVWQEGSASISLPPRVTHEELQLTGRGLAIVDALAESWGWQSTSESTLIWARIRPA